MSDVSGQPLSSTYVHFFKYLSDDVSLLSKSGFLMRYCSNQPVDDTDTDTELP